MLGRRRDKPFVDLTPFLAPELMASLSALDREITYGLAQLRPVATGGSHRSMGIMPPALAATALGDYGETLEHMAEEDFRLFVSLASNASKVDPRANERRAWGEDRALHLSEAQFRFLEYRGVYFPWKVYVELMAGGEWANKASPVEKVFSRDALTYFPATVAWISALPFASIGSVKLLGLLPLHHGTVHRDGAADPQRAPDPFISFCPRGDKRLYVWDERTGAKHYAPSSVYWFDDHDYHGVEADPFFRYSLRVDGAFDDAFHLAVESV